MASPTGYYLYTESLVQTQEGYAGLIGVMGPDSDKEKRQRFGVASADCNAGVGILYEYINGTWQSGAEWVISGKTAGDQVAYEICIAGPLSLMKKKTGDSSPLTGKEIQSALTFPDETIKRYKQKIKEQSAPEQ